MIGEIVENRCRAAGEVFARDALTIEVETLCGRPSPQAKSRAKPWKHIFRLERACEVTFGHYARRHVPVNRPRAAVGFLFDEINMGAP